MDSGCPAALEATIEVLVSAPAGRGPVLSLFVCLRVLPRFVVLTVPVSVNLIARPLNV